MTRDEWLASTDPKAMLARITKPGDSAFPQPVRVSDRKLRLWACACCRQVWHLLADDAVCERCRTYRQNLPPDPGCSDCGGTGRVNRSRRAVEVAERFADGLATDEERHAAWQGASNAWEDAEGAGKDLGAVLLAQVCVRRLTSEITRAYRSPRTLPPAFQAALLRDIVGDLWADAEVGLPCPQCRRRRGCVCQHVTPTVLALAHAAYDDRGEDGALCPDSLAVLADALEDAGCTEQTLLRHLRGEELVHWDSRKPVPSVYNHWRPLRGPHVRGCWAVDLLLGKE